VTPDIIIADNYLASESITLNENLFLVGSVISAERQYQLVINATDLAGNSTSDIVNFVIDLSAPETVVSWSAPKFESNDLLYLDGSASATLQSIDLGVVPSGVAGVEYSINEDIAAVYTSPIFLAGLTEGSHTIHFSASDIAGNVEDQNVVSFTIDNSAPVTTIQTEGVVYEGYASSAVMFTLEASDSFSGVSKTEYRIDSGAWGPYEPFGLQSDGHHVVEYRSYDNLGHIEFIQSYSIDIDSQPPTSTLNVDAPKFVGEVGLYVASDSRFIIAAVDSAAGIDTVQYRIDGGAWVDYQTYFTLPAEGDYLVEYQASDLLGNIETLHTLDVHVDNSAPETTATVLGTEYVADGQMYVTVDSLVQLAAEDAGVGVAKIEYRIDKGDWMVYTSPINLTGLSDGMYVIDYRATDLLGHQETDRQLTLSSDNSAPLSSVEVGEPRYQSSDTMYVGSMTMFTLTSQDELSGVAQIDYRLDDGEWTLYQHPVNLVDEGAHRIEYRGVDKLGTIETSKLIEFVLDATDPVSSVNISAQQYTDADGTLYIDPACSISISAVDPSSGVNRTEYRVDGGDWLVYSDPIYLTEPGEHLIEYLSRDQLDHAEAIKQISMTVDASAPQTDISVGDPQFTGDDGKLYVRSQTVFTLAAIDDYPGVASTAYQIDNSAWSEYLTPFTVADEGAHQLLYRSIDYLEHQEADRSFELIVDNTVPFTAISFEGISYLVGEQVILSSTAMVSLAAQDTFSGVRATYYRFGVESSWSQYNGSIGLDTIAPGPQQFQFYSVDNLGQVETEHTAELTLLDVTVKTDVLTAARVLVWAEEEKANGKSQPSYTSADVQDLVAQAFVGQDIFYELVTDKGLFQTKVRSGLFNTIMIVDQKTPLNSGFRRELREAVYRGDGLLVAQWGNSVHPIMQEVFGIDFAGSLPMNEGERVAQIYPSPLSENLNTSVYGRVLKTRLDGGQLAGVVLGESQCQGIKSLDIKVPIELVEGDHLAVTLSIPEGKKATIIDEEQTIVTLGQKIRVDDSNGNLSIESLTADAINLRVAAPLDYLGQTYSLTAQLYHADGTMTELGPYALMSDCADNPLTGIDYGGYEFTNVEEDRVKVGEDVPAIVLNNYGFGKAVFIAYDLMSTVITGDASPQADILRNAASYLMSDDASPKAGDIALLKTRLTVTGGSVELLAEETLGAGLTHEKLFGLDTDPLIYRFSLTDSEAAAYRYFVRFADQAGTYRKETALSLLTDGFELPFGVYPYDVIISQDVNTLYADAMTWIDAQIIAHPEENALLQGMRANLVDVHEISDNSQSDIGTKIDGVTQLIDTSNQLSFDNTQIRLVVGEYLRLLQIKWSQF